MAKVNIVYASLTGNTEELVNVIAEKLKSKSVETELIDAYDVDVKQAIGADALVVATYTYGQGEIPDEMLDFFDGLKQESLSGVKFAVAGSGDKGYGDMFCAAASQFDKMLGEQGATRIADLIKIEFSPETDEDMKNIEDFASSIAKKL